ncbi:GGDEF domain-containing protein [Aquitalea sp. FJL05]|uniref:GGDEF domain-containing protein n=1 Tax=Aquitalea sp. FJL05 TaxID=2153366 RepID=UPI000F5A0569|nr:diguanylate cyclase [Aquitalea sp. FJL05]RQO77658.1 GGDEF domain-containing protein [Aquitalea sp. FJL05]
MSAPASVPVLLPVFLVTDILCACILVQLLALRKAGVAGTRSWIAANIAMVAYLPALGLRTVLPLVFSVVLSNGLGLLAASLFYIGCARFLGRPAYSRFWLALILCALAGLLWFTLVVDVIRLRVIIASGGIAVVFVATAYLLCRHRPAGQGAVVYWLGAACSIATALLHTARAIYYGAGLGNLSDLFASTPANVMSMSLTAALVPGLSMLAAAMVQQQLLSDATWRAERDGMTGTLTRQSFETRILADLQRANLTGDAFCFVLADLDFFKQINDSHGHQTGDRVLVAFTELIRRHVRAADYIGRMGGEEFGIALPATPPAEAMRVAERLRLAVAAQHIATDSGSLSYRVSMGLAVREQGETFADLYRHADQALYAAKQAGRNRVQAYAQDAA